DRARPALGARRPHLCAIRHLPSRSSRGGQGDPDRPAHAPVGAVFGGRPQFGAATPPPTLGDGLEGAGAGAGAGACSGAGAGAGWGAPSPSPSPFPSPFFDLSPSSASY